MKKTTFILLFFTICSFNLLKAQPETPVNLKASVETWFHVTFIKLTWETSQSSHTSFIIYKKNGAVNSDGEFYRLSNSEQSYGHNSYLDKMVSPGMTYSYFITAKVRNGESGHSDTVEISLPDSLSPAFVYGTLTDASTGSGLQKGKVEFIPSFGWQSKKITADSLGKYSSQIIPGKYFIEFSSPGYVTQFYNNARSIFDATQLQINENDSLEIDASLNPVVVPKKFMLSGTVTDTSGVPVKSQISVFSLNHHFFINSYHHAWTDSAGNYSVMVKEGDSVVVFANPRDRQYLPQFYNGKTEFAEADRIYINGDITGIDFVLEEKPVYNNSISGNVADDSGNGLLANVTLFKLKDPNFIKYKKTTMTDSLGNFNFTNINPGIYILFTIPERGYLPSFFRYDGTTTLKWKEADSVIVTDTSQITGINFMVDSIPDTGFGRIAGRIKDEDNKGVDGAIVYATDENLNIAGFTTTDENGSYTINNLPPGTYSVLSDKFNYNSSTANNISVDYSTTLSQDVSLTLTALNPTTVNESNVRATNYKLSQNYPNPFNPSTIINYQIPAAGWVTLKVYNVIGQEVTTLVNIFQPAGSYNVRFDASKYESGIYFYTLYAGNTVLTKKMVLIK